MFINWVSHSSLFLQHSEMWFHCCAHNYYRCSSRKHGANLWTSKLLFFKIVLMVWSYGGRLMAYCNLIKATFSQWTWEVFRGDWTTPHFTWAVWDLLNNVLSNKINLECYFFCLFHFCIACNLEYSFKHQIQYMKWMMLSDDPPLKQDYDLCGVCGECGTSTT